MPYVKLSAPELAMSNDAAAPGGVQRNERINCACRNRIGAICPASAPPSPAIAPISATRVSPRARFRRNNDPRTVPSHFDNATPNSAIGSAATNVGARLPVPKPAPIAMAMIAGTAITEWSVVNSLMKSTANSLRKVIGYSSSLPASNCLPPPRLKGTVAHIRYMKPKIEKNTNSAVVEVESSRGALPSSWAKPSGRLTRYATKPSTKATKNANANASIMPKSVATLLTTAFDERSELRSRCHLSQMSVKSCDIFYNCLPTQTVQSTKHKVQI